MAAWGAAQTPPTLTAAIVRAANSRLKGDWFMFDSKETELG